MLNTLGLDGIQDEKIGSPDQGGLPRAVRKKITIATELVTRPSLLFLDVSVCETLMLLHVNC